MFTNGTFSIVNKILKRKSKIIPKSRQVYAIGTGTYVGEMLVYCRKDEDFYHFLSIPKNINRTVPIEKFDFALEHKIAEYVTDLPKNVYNLCYKQFEYNLKNTK